MVSNPVPVIELNIALASDVIAHSRQHDPEREIDGVRVTCPVADNVEARSLSADLMSRSE